MILMLWSFRNSRSRII